MSCSSWFPFIIFITRDWHLGFDFVFFVVISNVVFKFDFFCNSTETRLNFIEVRQFRQVTLKVPAKRTKHLLQNVTHTRLVMLPVGCWMVRYNIGWQNVSELDSQNENNPETSLWALALGKIDTTEKKKPSFQSSGIRAQDFGIGSGFRSP